MFLDQKSLSTYRMYLVLKPSRLCLSVYLVSLMPSDGRMQQSSLSLTLYRY